MFLPREESEELLRHLERKEATALIGPRRAGKSTLAQHMLDVWQGTRGKGIFIELEKPGQPPTIGELDKKLEEIKKGGLVVLDEIQNVNGWEKWVRKIIEDEKYRLILTGSNSKLLSSEVASTLAGRAIPYKIMTLSFRDFKRWSGKGLEEYLRIGGYPECVKRPDEENELIETYFELAVIRDVAMRYDIREIAELRSFATIALSETGKTISIPKTAMKLGVSAPTTRQFLRGLEEAFLLLTVPAFDRSPRERETSMKRLYGYDLGMRNVISISESADRGRVFENLVAIELVRRGYSLSYMRGDQWECDFIAQKIGKPALAVQVWSGDEKLPERELVGLENAMKQLKARGMLLSEKTVEEKMPLGITMQGIEDWLLNRKQSEN